MKAAIRLLVTIFTSTLDIPEFQRQLCTPNVTKFTSALSSLATSASDIDLKVRSLRIHFNQSLCTIPGPLLNHVVTIDSSLPQCT
jgi:hypothetical protein